jgi:cytochrome c oxidase assembly factor CtaG
MPSVTSAAAWPVQAPFFLVVAAGVLYQLGGRRSVPGHRENVERRWRSAAFYGGLLTVVVATDTPLDPLSDTLFSAHMAQHILLLMVAPSLIVLAAPWLRLWQPLPLGLRRTLAKGVARGRWATPLRALGRTLSRPLPAWIAFNAVVVAWHVPPLYDATLSNEAVHDLEHALFFLAGTLFWLQIVDSPPVRARLEYGLRAVYLTGALLVSWVLAIVLALSSSPLYPAYAHLGHRTAGLSALADQQIAGGVMWVPGSIPFTIAFVWALYRWLDPAEDPSIRARRNGHRPHRGRASATS